MDWQKVLKYGEIEPNWRIQKTIKKPAVFRRAWGLKYTQRGGILREGVPPWGGVRRGAAPRHFLEFVRLQGARKWHSCTRWGPNSVVYSHGHHQVFVSVSRPEWTPKFAQKSQGRSNLAASVPKWEWPTQWLYDMPRNVDPSVKKGVGLKQLAYCML